MLAFALHYLNGWAMAAADGAKKELPEWPPHPDRVFMALAAAHFETDGGDKGAEHATLQWLESLPPPALAASGHEERRTVTHFVPVNDAGLSTKKRISDLTQAASPSLAALKDAGLGQLPEYRSRQARGFPVAVPHVPIVHLIWPNAEPTESQRTVLTQLCRKVTHVGHSASLVSLWIDDRPPPASWIPSSALVGQRLRVPCTGRLAHLSARCGRDIAIRWSDLHAAIADIQREVKATTGPRKKALKAEQARLEEVLMQTFPDGSPVAALDPRLFRPDPGRWQGYGPPAPTPRAPIPGTVFDPTLIVFALSGKRLALPATLRLTAVLRNTIIKKCPVQPPPEWLCGHLPDGNPSPHPHLACIPLPFLEDQYADGRIMGVALALPRELDSAESARCLGEILRDAHGHPIAHRLFDREWIECTAELETRSPSPQKSLRNALWTDPAKRWASVTPVVLDRHYDGKDKWEQAAESVKTACERIGLPRPTEVVLHPVSMFAGAPRSSDFPAVTRKSDGGRMHHSHALLIFDQEVAGPLLVGAGRFRGYGLFRPLRQGGDHV